MKSRVECGLFGGFPQCVCRKGVIILVDASSAVAK